MQVRVFLQEISPNLGVGFGGVHNVGQVVLFGADILAHNLVCRGRVSPRLPKGLNHLCICEFMSTAATRATNKTRWMDPGRCVRDASGMRPGRVRSAQHVISMQNHWCGDRCEDAEYQHGYLAVQVGGSFNTKNTRPCDDGT